MIVAFIIAYKLSSKERWKYIAFLPLVFVCLHIAYGVGSLIGLIRYVLRWNDNK